MKRIFRTQVKSGLVPALFRGWNQWEEGDFIEGVYDSSYMSEYNGQEQHNWRIKVTAANFQVETKEGDLVNPIGQLLVLNSAGQLNKMMLESEKGWGVYVEYGGKKAGSDPKNKTKYHTFINLETGPLISDEDQDEAGL